MRITHLYTDTNGQSAFKDIDLSLERCGVEQQRELPGTSSLLVNETDAGHSYPWHNAPRRQWVVILQGEIEVTLRTGESRRFGKGDFVLADDLTGTGHATRVISKEPWRCVYMPFEGEVK